MLNSRLRRSRQPRRMGDQASQLSFIAAFGVTVALIVFFATRLLLYYGLLSSVSLFGTHAAAAAPPLVVTQSMTGDTQDALAEAGFATPAPAGPLLVVPTPNRANAIYLPILMYHYIRVVSPQRDKLGWNLSVTPSDFDAQMAWLSAHGYTPVTMSEAVLILEKKRPAPRLPIALTFDDGYEDFYTDAVPVLRRYNFTATSYIPTRLIGLPAYMTWAQVVELDQAGFEIAAHTQFHVGLARTSLARARTEIFGSLADLEAQLGHPVTDFCYPYGSFDPAVVALVKQAGFLSATSTINGVWHDVAQMFFLTRVRVGGGESLSYWSHTFAPTNLGWPVTTSFATGYQAPVTTPRVRTSASPASSPSASPR